MIENISNNQDRQLSQKEVLVETNMLIYWTHVETGKDRGRERGIVLRELISASKVVELSCNLLLDGGILNESTYNIPDVWRTKWISDRDSRMYEMEEFHTIALVLNTSASFIQRTLNMRFLVFHTTINNVWILQHGRSSLDFIWYMYRTTSATNIMTAHLHMISTCHHPNRPTCLCGLCHLKRSTVILI